jgi:2-oxoisovalerate dehydrogenase E2 component (dihydrolipoyl transacylase)
MSEYVFKLPDLGEGTVESEIGEWFINVGDKVKEEDVVGTMMTDKAAIEVSSPVSGTVIELGGKPGDIIAVGAPLVTFETENDVAAATAPAAEAAPAAVAESPAAAATTANRDGSGTATPAGQRVKTSPAIRRRAKEAGIDLRDVPATGPGGRVTRTDFDGFLKSGTQPRAGRDRGTSPPARADAGAKEIKVIGLRRIIAERLAQAAREIPHFTYVEEIDITEVDALRRHLNDKLGDPTLRFTLLPFLGMALIRAIREFPQCNATYDKERNVILQHNAVHLGIATQTPDGLKVPVVHHADALSLEELGAAIRRVTAAARDNSIGKGDLTGSTITITSLGKLGGIVSTPVINLPEVGIIGVNRAVERPVVIGGQVAIRLMMNLSSSFDHRFVDGYDAAAMIQRLKEMLEHPATIFLP